MKNSNDLYRARGEQISLRAAVEKLHRLFAGANGVRERSPNDIYEAAGRAAFDEAANRRWLANTLTALKYHGLVQPAYDFSSAKRRLALVRLTSLGADSMGKTLPSRKSRRGSLDSLIQLIDLYRQQHPTERLELTISFRETEPDNSLERAGEISPSRSAEV